MKRLHLFVTFGLLLALVGCAGLPQVSLPPEWDAVRLGMAASDVRSLLGEPHEVIDYTAAGEAESPERDPYEWCRTLKLADIEQPREAWVYHEPGERLMIGFNESGAAVFISRASRAIAVPGAGRRGSFCTSRVTGGASTGCGGQTSVLGAITRMSASSASSAARFRARSERSPSAFA